MAEAVKNAVTIEVSQGTYDRLKRKAVPFEDTPDTVIAKLLDESAATGTGPPTLGSGGNGRRARDADLEVEIHVGDPLNPPSLKHTRVLRAEVDGRDVAKANWTLVRHAVAADALARPGWDLRRLLGISPMNAVEGLKEEDGYAFYEDLGVSIQGQDANHAWQAAAAPARALGIAVKVWFQWRAKPDAAHPGKRGLLSIG